MKNIWNCIFSLLILFSYVAAHEDYGSKDKVICISIPKAGTHLLIKCLTLMEIEGITYDFEAKDRRIKSIQTAYQSISLEAYADRAFSRLSYRLSVNQDIRKSFLVHLPFSEKYKSFFDEFTVANFLMIRDPRDQLVSLASTALADRKNREGILKDILLDLLEGTQRQLIWKPHHGGCDLVWTVGIVKFYQSFLQWALEPTFHVVRFENLIGPEGGGTETAQIQEINLIARHLGTTLSLQQMSKIRKNLFGDSRTFVEGQTKCWQKYFTPEVKEAFKKVPGACELLIHLGYEKDCNW